MLINTTPAISIRNN